MFARGRWLAQDALLVVEEDKRAGFIPLSGFDEIIVAHGDTEITLLSNIS